MVFAGIFPTDNRNFDELLIAIEKLKLTDASITTEKESR